MSTSPGPKRDAEQPAGERRRGRERAIALLYEGEMKGVDVTTVLAELPSPPEAYADELVAGVGAHGREIDELIESHATAWAIERMPAIDRQLLRVATFELLAGSVPVAVALDEAVELAKEYSTEDSARFVNGVLAAIARQLRPDEVVEAGGDGS